MVAAVLNTQMGAGAALGSFDHGRLELLTRHDVADHNGGTVCHQQRLAELLTIAQHAVDLGHGGIALGRYLRRTASHHDARPGPGPASLADGLTRLALGLGRHSAGVKNDHVVEPRRTGAGYHRLRLPGVEPTAERDHLRRWSLCAHGRRLSVSPRKLVATSPVIQT